MIRASKTLNYLTNYSFVINTILKAKNGQDFESAFNSTFTTGIDSSLKFDLLSKESLLDSIQKKTFRYFWEFGHPVSGLIRERNTSGELVTSGEMCIRDRKYTHIALCRRSINVCRSSQ